MTNRTCAMRSNDSTPPRHLIAAGTGSDPMLDEALRRARRIDELDQAAHAAASYVRRPAVTA